MRRLIAFAIVAIVTMREKATSVLGRIGRRVAAGVSLRVVNEAKSVYDECHRRKKGTSSSLGGLHRDDNVDLGRRKCLVKDFPFDPNPLTIATFTSLSIHLSNISNLVPYIIYLILLILYRLDIKEQLRGFINSIMIIYQT